MKKVDIACIIDDDPIFVFGTKKILELANFCNSFMVFQNGEEALNNLKPIVESGGPSIPDIILLDLNMPIMDGWQFLEEFTKIPSEQQILIYIALVPLFLESRALRCTCQSSKCFFTLPLF